ncbi:hypothetical protein FNV43_RR20310 [Rhamnella rubrinervis]|uniref:ACT domain-containing protein ACR n=1 Tax=Rhamnella rubrinervis TaxID=2594499 RepID=A0A8K0DUK7_9ROSA|nr:hypothetical protein FNV43_RR20310 [Rhamnella rubrinervis]
MKNVNKKLKFMKIMKWLRILLNVKVILKSWEHQTEKECDSPRPIRPRSCKKKKISLLLVRPKLLFDTLCCLTDMQYSVFHGTVITGRREAYQEYYIRHIDGLPQRSEAERQRVLECLEAATERRATEGLELELCTTNKHGLLSDATRIFRENSLYIRRAEISTNGGKVKDTFWSMMFQATM